MKGRYVSFKNNKGIVQKAIVYNHEQSADFFKIKKVFVHYLDDNLQPKKDEHGKKIVGLRNTKELTVIGFID